MKASVVIRSKDEAGRLRLTLAALSRQTKPVELIVVNDGSRDHTAEVVAEASARIPIVRVDHASARGRSAASNAGAAQATGDVLIFLDGDVLVGSDFVERHLALHETRARVIGRGDSWHLRQTRFFLDPETGAPMPGEEDRVLAMSDLDRERSRVSLRDVVEDFDSITRRAQPGLYPGAGPRRLYDIEMQALTADPECEVLWAAASGHNLSVDRSTFVASGGFDPLLTINEHRELALRLCGAGLTLAFVSGAKSVHMTHRRGWRDPLSDSTWHERFFEAHPIPAVALLTILWASLDDRPPFPDAARISTLAELAAAARRITDASSIAAVRQAHFAAAAVSAAA